MNLNDENNLKKMRHSCEHVLTMAMLRLWGNKVKAAMGPATDDGFYFDFDSNIKITETDFPKIETEMSKIIKENLAISREEFTIGDAKKFFGQNIYKGNQYKHEWLDSIDKRGEKVNVYSMGPKNKDIPIAFVDICSGPHVETTSQIGPFKLLSIAGAYWHGDEKNKMLTRIYGTCFTTQKELDHYLWQIEEAKKRDHRKIGKELDLFVFSELVGKGLPLFTEKGSIVRRELERYIVDEEIKRGYSHVYTSDLANVSLYKKSGHFPYYKDSMYPVMKIDEEELILRPMTCPHHFQLYLSKSRSYKDLPVRFAELAKQFRYEKSGELTGLMRVRSFCLADAHIICQPNQALEEINQVLDLIEDAANVLNFKKGEDFRYRLSLGDREDNKKYYQDDGAWDYAEELLRKVLIKRKSPYFEAKGEAAFYGPKIDIQMKDFAGREDTAFTVQYDFVMPKRFELNYIDKDGREKEAIVIHRSSIGCIERVMAFLIEKYAGAFPVWLSPVQVVVLPVSEKTQDYAQEVFEKIKNEDIRVEIEANQTLSYRIRQWELQKVPYILVIGEKEKKNQSITVRKRQTKKLEELKLNQFISQIKEKISSRSLLV